MSAEVAHFMLSNNLIRFTQPIAFNDPYDVYPRLSNIIPDEKVKELFLMLTGNELAIEELINKAIEQEEPKLTPELKALFSIIPLKKLFNTYIKKNYNSFNEFFLSQVSPQSFRDRFIPSFLFFISNYIGILSLSKICDNLLMWSHYGNCHKGIVVEFDDNHPFLQQFENGVFEKKLR